MPRKKSTVGPPLGEGSLNAFVVFFSFQLAGVQYALTITLYMLNEPVMVRYFHRIGVSRMGNSVPCAYSISKSLPPNTITVRFVMSACSFGCTPKSKL